MHFLNEDPVDVRARGDLEPLYDTTGRLVRPRQRSLHAQFRRGTAPPWAQEIGIPMFEWRRKPTDVPAAAWLAYYDSVEDQALNGWTDEERQVIEAKLLEVAGCVQIEPAPLSPPWPAYGRMKAGRGESAQAFAARLAEKVREDGHDVNHVIAFERENKNRKTVLEALEALRSEGSEPVVPDEEKEAEEAVVTA